MVRGYRCAETAGQSPGQPDENMPALRAFDLQVSLDILVYLQSVKTPLDKRLRCLVTSLSGAHRAVVLRIVALEEIDRAVLGIATEQKQAAVAMPVVQV